MGLGPLANICRLYDSELTNLNSMTKGFIEKKGKTFFVEDIFCYLCARIDKRDEKRLIGTIADCGVVDCLFGNVARFGRLLPHINIGGICRGGSLCRDGTARC